MKHLFSKVLPTAVVLAVATLSAAARAQSITVDTSRTGIRTSPLLFGIFFEEINRAGEGGIYAEMIQNRS